MPEHKCAICDTPIQISASNNYNKYCSQDCKKQGMKFSGTIAFEYEGRRLFKQFFRSKHTLKSIYSHWIKTYTKGEIIVTFN